VVNTPDRLLGGRWFGAGVSGYGSVMEFILWILAVVLVVAGIVSLVRGQMLWGIVLIIVGLLVGPGGVSIFSA
jgi:hypothetical protein